MSKSSSSRGGQNNNNNRANQLNTNNPAYQGSRQGSGNSKPALDAPTKPDHGADDAEDLAEEFGGSND